jgi:VanZ family protein
MAFTSWLPAILYAAMIWLLSSQERPPGAGMAPDYILHALEYGLFSLTLAWGLTAGLRKRLAPSTVFWAWLLSVVYGVSDEVHQYFVKNRSASLQDVAADAVGALLFLGLAYVLLKDRRRTP